MRFKRSRSIIVFGVVVLMALTTSLAIALAKQTPSLTTGGPKLGSPYIPVTQPGKMPAFTLGDVRTFIHQHGFPLNPRVKDDRITSISFITAAQASARMKNEYIGLPADALVCYVEFSGPIPLVGQSRPLVGDPAHPAPMYTAKVGQMVIDASDGYLLVTGGI